MSEPLKDYIHYLEDRPDFWDIARELAVEKINFSQYESTALLYAIARESKLSPDSGVKTSIARVVAQYHKNNDSPIYRQFYNG